MDYKFPVDITLDQVKEAIKGSDEFKVSVKENFTVVNYVYCTEDSFDTPLKSELRGLVFDNDTGLVINRRFHKFFNVGEKLNAEEIDISRPHVILEKLDGSMVSPIMIKGGNIRWITKMGHSDVALKAETFCASRPDLIRLAEGYLSHSCCEGEATPIFEYTAPTNRIVVDYKEEKMTLLAIRYNKTGRYIPYDILREIGQSFGVPVVNKLCDEVGEFFSDFMETIKDFEDSEGIVIQFEDGHMVKIKADWYVKLHKAKEVLSNEKNLIALFLDDNLDDVLPLLNEEDKQKLLDKQKLFWDSVLGTLQILSREGGKNASKTRKDFALEFIPTMPKCAVPWLFKMYEEGFTHDITENYKDFLVKSLNTNDKINQNRMLIGGYKYV